jgi:outer membrane receptor protein involved in Fe transport
VKGKGRDYGVMLDVFGDGRFFARGTYFEVARLGDANDTPSGAVANANGLGRQQAIRILDAFLAAGKLSQAEYDQQSFNYTSAQDDVITKGYELELVANLTPNWTTRFGYSYSDRERANFFLEGYSYYADRFVAWRDLARGDAALSTLVESNIQEIEEYLADRQFRIEQPYGTSPHKFNVTSRYTFSQERVKGLFIGGAARYQGAPFLQQDLRPAPLGDARRYFGESTFFIDVFAGHRFKLPWFKSRLSVQLNVRNLLNRNLSTPGRYTTDFVQMRRVYLNDPRSWRLTTSLDF